MTTRTILIPYPHLTKDIPPHSFTPLDKLPPKLYYSMSFFPRTVAEWNQLPQSVAAAPSLEAFSDGVEAITRSSRVFLTCTSFFFLTSFLSCTHSTDTGSVSLLYLLLSFFLLCTQPCHLHQHLPFIIECRQNYDVSFITTDRNTDPTP